ncbi:EthD family reductase [Sphingomonas sp. PP-CC-3G-468]|uniref:EthD family reductase n=1 Tax=Sphingomonas sp. PP-CC-3G-468 TaxID=2135656 RepID=UPI001042D345|nr:EthD family reductase [Sphingomonas sp. PP-CC-3G-468]TCM02915.1 uncharacterized protein (TIGR02118 family) [Sphingomonas sp. PP-CC-3G-468]
MTVKLLAMYRRPDDVDAFLTHYRDVHVPLIEAVPGLAKLVVNRVDGDLMGGPAPYFLIAELHFADETIFEAAMASPENRSAGKDVMTFAKGLVTMLKVHED